MMNWTSKELEMKGKCPNSQLWISIRPKISSSGRDDKAKQHQYVIASILH
jgi:hypothetical protein